MVKRKVSATVEPERIRRAQVVTGSTNLSELIERGLDALIERELERRWVSGYQQHPDGDEFSDLPGEVRVDLSAVPWDEQR